MKFKRVKINNLACTWWGKIVLAVETVKNVFSGYIARNESRWYDGRNHVVYTAFYPKNEKWVYKEFLRLKEAKEWLIKELERR